MKSDQSLVSANLVADSGAFTNYVNSSFAETLGYPVQDVSSMTGAGADGGQIVSSRAWTFLYCWQMELSRRIDITCWIICRRASLWASQL